MTGNHFNISQLVCFMPRVPCSARMEEVRDRPRCHLLSNVDNSFTFYDISINKIETRLV